jgi:ribonuclease G
LAPRGQRNDRGDRSGVEAAPVDLSAAAEPFILPGESLSKYRRGDDASASESPARSSQSAPVNLVVARPSTEVAPLLGWDGGAVLPGETLSRHRDRSPQSTPQAQPTPQAQSAPQTHTGSRHESYERGGDRRRERDERRGRAPRPQSEQPNSDRQEFRPSGQPISPAEAVQPAITSQHEIEPYENETDALPVEIHATHAEVAEALEEFHETVAEYEPGHHASASYRVDPAGPSEFRQGAPLAELALEGPIPEHSFTAVQPSGEMISEIPEDGPHAEAGTHPDAPIEHEQAIQAVHLDQASRSAVPFDTAQGFAFGDGQLEEELLDDEEGTPGALHTAPAAAPASEDTEEETLEHAADLGSMIRDMSIDQITRPGAAEQEEDDEVDFDDDADFEEDELESTGEDDADDEEFSGSDVSEAEEEDFAEAADTDESAPAPRVIAGGEGQVREGGRRGRRDGRRGGRDRNPGRGSERGPDRSPSPDRGPERTSDRSASNGHRDRRGMANSRPGGDRRPGRHSVQASDLPAISDLLKPGQEVLVQIAKEPIAKKGARITSHIALPGRFLVFMPTVSHVGVSRKIESDAERRRLKEILLSERGEATGGFIVRTAAAGASEEDLRSDLRFLLNLWVDIKARSESSKSPALIYHDLNLIERILRDQVTDNFSAIWVDTEAEYERVLRFLQRFQPALVRRVKLYGKDTPLFEQFGINAEIDKALRSKVWLKSGGSIVINQTEALVAIDINTGKFVGKTTKLEDTIVKTNLDAIPEIVRQIRLRDLGGIIIIDFIDMDERKNRNRVMAALEEELKKDRAPSKVLQFNDFGLVAITRKRVKQSLERTLSTTCAVCQGTGMTKSAVTVCNDLYIEMRKMHKTIEKGDIMLRVHPEVVKQLKSVGGKWLQEMEEMSGKTILVKSDPTLHPEQFDIH